jgi:hypothetical protein
MYGFTKVAVFVASSLSLASSAVAAPMEAGASSNLVVRAPYDVHNGWVSNIF